MNSIASLAPSTLAAGELPAPATFLDIAHSEAIAEDARRKARAADMLSQAPKLRTEHGLTAQAKLGQRSYLEVAQTNTVAAALLAAARAKYGI